MPRYLGIDYGTKRIGLAVSNPEATLALPLATVEVGGKLADHASAILAYVRDYEVDEIVIGLPINMDDTEGPQAKLTRAFGHRLTQATGLPVNYIDERLSSFSAEEMLRPAELTHKKKKGRLDRVAAQIILQAFLDTQTGG